MINDPSIINFISTHGKRITIEWNGPYNPNGDDTIHDTGWVCLLWYSTSPAPKQLSYIQTSGAELEETLFELQDLFFEETSPAPSFA